MPSIYPNVTVSQSDYADVVVSMNTEPSYHYFSERNGYTTSISTIPTTDNTSLNELMNRIYKLELDVYELKQQLRGDIKL